MARTERDAPADGPIVTGFSGIGFKVSGRYCPGGLLLTPETALDWDAPSIDLVTDADLAPLLALDPRAEFILLGTGAALRRPSPALVAAIEGRGVGIEAMDSRAAARAWGLLRGEGRWIGAALLPLS